MAEGAGHSHLRPKLLISYSNTVFLLSLAYQVNVPRCMGRPLFGPTVQRLRVGHGADIISPGQASEEQVGTAGSPIEAFITRWQGRHGGQERANYALFRTELCDALGLAHQEPASAEHEANDYVFERVVREAGRNGAISNRRIDLYKRDSFVLEAKQSRQVLGGYKQVQGQTDLFVTEAAPRGRRGADRAWDVLMLNARRQAEDYVCRLPRGHESPPFVIVCDAGPCLQVYASLRRYGKGVDQFPERRAFRIYLDDLR